MAMQADNLDFIQPEAIFIEEDENDFLQKFEDISSKIVEDLNKIRPKNLRIGENEEGFLSNKRTIEKIANWLESVDYLHLEALKEKEKIVGNSSQETQAMQSEPASSKSATFNFSEVLSCCEDRKKVLETYYSQLRDPLKRLISDLENLTNEGLYQLQSEPKEDGIYILEALLAEMNRHFRVVQCFKRDCKQMLEDFEKIRLWSCRGYMDSTERKMGLKKYSMKLRIDVLEGYADFFLEKLRLAKSRLKILLKEFA